MILVNNLYEFQVVDYRLHCYSVSVNNYIYIYTICLFIKFLASVDMD